MRGFSGQSIIQFTGLSTKNTDSIYLQDKKSNDSVYLHSNNSNTLNYGRYFEV